MEIGRLIETVKIPRVLYALWEHPGTPKIEKTIQKYTQKYTGVQGGPLGGAFLKKLCFS